MNAKATIIVVLTLILLGAGGFYAGQKYKLVPAFGPTPTVTTSSPSDTATPTTAPTSTGQAVDEKAAVIAAVKASEFARIGADANTETYTVTQIQGDYAKGSAGGEGGGAQWFAAKVNSTWKLVFIGNGTIACADLTSYPNYPSAWIPECWDGTKSITR